MIPEQPTATMEYSELAPNVTVIVLEVVSAPVFPVDMNMKTLDVALTLARM
jgi:hypothetical protein